MSQSTVAHSRFMLGLGLGWGRWNGVDSIESTWISGEIGQ